METRDRLCGVETFNNNIDTKHLNNKNMAIFINVKRERSVSSSTDIDMDIRRSVDEELALSDDSSDDEEYDSKKHPANRSGTPDVLPYCDLSEASDSDLEQDTPKQSTVGFNTKNEDDEDNDSDSDGDEDLSSNQKNNSIELSNNEEVLITSNNEEEIPSYDTIAENGQSTESSFSRKRTTSSCSSSSSASVVAVISPIDKEKAERETLKSIYCFKCNYCRKRFRSNADLTRHIRSHTGEKPFKCEHCSRSFSQTSHLQRHLLTHPDKVKIHKCPICNKTYSQKVQLSHHMVMHKKERAKVKNLSLKCSYCQKQFHNGAKYRNHISAHVNGTLHICDVCGRSFKLKSYLVVHQRTHTQTKVYTGDKPFVCTICSKAFLSSSNLELHSTIHKYEKTSFPCEVCGKEFSRKSNYVAHAKSHYR